MHCNPYYILCKIYVLPLDILLNFVANKVPNAHDMMLEMLILEKRRLEIQRE